MKLKYLEATIINKRRMHEEINKRINSRNVRYYSGKKPLPLDYYNTNIKIKIQNCNYACRFYGCGTSSSTLTEEYRSMVFQNKMLRIILGSKREEVTLVP
jgi:hypothetical protein